MWVAMPHASRTRGVAFLRRRLLALAPPQPNNSRMYPVAPRPAPRRPCAASQANTFITHLNIGNTEIGTETLIALATVLNSNATLTHLNIENPRTFSKTEDPTYHLARMLQVNRTLRYLNMGKHRICDFGASLLSEHLMENTTLQVLDLRCNNIAGVGGEALATLLVRSAQLVQLNLENNRITDHGACAMEQALRRNRTLEVLNLCNNEIEDKGLEAIASALEENTAIRHLQLWGNTFGVASKAAFLRLFETRFRYVSIAIDFKPYVVDGEVQTAKVDI